MAQHGGYRKPSNPAPASGPGKMSRRTDGGPAQAAKYVSGLEYGGGEELMTAQQAAPMAAAGTGPVPQGDLGMLQQSPQGLFDPTERPLTQGQPFGEGAGPEVLATGGEPAPTRDKLMAALPMLMKVAESPTSSPELRALVTYLRAQQR
jgi:hypothetical protein